MKNIHDMSRKELMTYAIELGARPGESLEDTATRFEHHNEGKANLFHEMAVRWWALEGGA
jgi:hypothetical protein